MNDDAMDYYFSGEELMDETEPEPAPVRKSGSSKPQQSQGGESRVGSVLAIIFVSVLAAALLGAVIYALDKRNTLYNKVSSLNNELHLAEAENVRLQSELESQMSAKKCGGLC